MGPSYRVGAESVPAWCRAGRVGRQRAIAPQTVAGTALATLVMILGYGIPAVPTGIATAEIVESAVALRKVSTRGCPQCLAEGHETDARFCKACGAPLEPEAGSAEAPSP